MPTPIKYSAETRKYHARLGALARVLKTDPSRQREVDEARKSMLLAQAEDHRKIADELTKEAEAIVFN